MNFLRIRVKLCLYIKEFYIEQALNKAMTASLSAFQSLSSVTSHPSSGAHLGFEVNGYS